MPLFCIKNIPNFEFKHPFFVYRLVEDVKPFFMKYLSWDNSKKTHKYIYFPDFQDKLPEAA